MSVGVIIILSNFSISIKFTKFVLHDTADSKTIDERILEIQQAKRKIMSKCLKDESLENNGIEQTSVKVKLSLDDILGLLQ